MKRTLMIAGLALVILVAGLSLIPTGETVPDAVMDEPLTLIDVESGELITLPRERWVKLGREGRLYRHPDTGKYTMNPTVECASCGKLVANTEQVCPHCGGLVWPGPDPWALEIPPDPQEPLCLEP